MERSNDLPESLLERRKPELKSDPTQTDVGKHRIGAQRIGEQRTDHDPARRHRYAPDVQRAVHEACKRLCELLHPDRIGVHEKIPAADFAALGEIHERASAVVDVDRGYPRSGSSKLRDVASGKHRLDDAFAKPRGVSVDPSRKGGHDWRAGGKVSVDAIERGSKTAPPC